MTQNFNITRTDDGTVTVLHLQGHLDAQAEGILKEQAQQTYDSGVKYLLADLSGLEMVTSAGLRALHAIYKLFTPSAEIEAFQKNNPEDVFKSPYFKLAGASSNVHYVLSISGFLQNIPIYPDVRQALDSFK